MGRLLDLVAPPWLGRGFRWLLASSWTSNIGDGIALAAGPLLVASQTRNPILVAMAAMLQRLPWLVFGLWAGAIADRADRRMLVVVADVLRTLVVGVLCLAIATGRIDVGVVLVTMFLYGVAQVFADTASGPLMPMLVEREDLGIGKARLHPRRAVGAHGAVLVRVRGVGAHARRRVAVARAHRHADEHGPA